MYVSSEQQPMTAIAPLPSQPHRAAKRFPLTVRHAEASDAAALHTIFHHPDVLYWTVDLPFAPTETTQQHLLQNHDESYVLLACDGPIIVGALRLSVYPSPRMRHAGRIGPVAVHPQHQGKGVGSTLLKAAVDLADNWLNLRRLNLLVFADNDAAIKLYRKMGFLEEGMLRDLAFRDGSYVDGLLMARIKSDAR